MQKVNNKVVLYGEDYAVKRFLIDARKGKYFLDFDKFNSIDEDKNDVEMTDFLNFAFNYYINSNPGLEEELVNTFTFFGRTRKYPYEFRILSADEYNSFLTTYSKKKIEKELNKVIHIIESKMAFNGYIVRTTLWGTGSGPANVYLDADTIYFTTYSTPAVKLFTEISKNYPGLKMRYKYEIDGKETELKIKRGIVKVVSDEVGDLSKISSCALIFENVKL